MALRCFLLLVILGCSLDIRADNSPPVTVFAAVSLTNALNEIYAQYPTPAGATSKNLRFNFSASGLLARQINEGAPCDIFISADEAQMDKLEKAGRLEAGTRKDLLGNALVVIGEASAAPHLQGTALLDHLAPTDKIAIGQPNIVPAGTYAKIFLTQHGLWEKLQPQIVPCENVRAVLAAVESGNAAYGLVYKTDALISKKVQILYEVSESEGLKIRYPVALVRSDRQRPEASAFLAYLFNPDAQAIFKKYGFVPLSTEKKLVTAPAP